MKGIMIEEYLAMEEKKIAKQSTNSSFEKLCGGLDVYEPLLCYDENERIYAEAVILINNRLVRLINMTVEKWLELKFGDNKKVDNEVKESVVSTWLIRSYKKQFEEYMEVKKDDEEVPTYDELSDLEEENLRLEDGDLKDEALKENPSWKDHVDMRTEKERTFALDKEWFDDHEPMNDDDDIGDLDEYLISNDAPYYVDEEE
uniref:Uncharacterized protein n=1 Tax=Tanacetum cinerariifolium TaxID=118510 RepID=A0A6L2L2Z9_TANCI|nr:hypothetical protein [Tanacetum cinerariifolium]